MPINIGIFHISTRSFAGGPKMLFRLISGLNKGSYTPVLILTDARDPLYPMAKKENIKTYILPQPKLMEVRDKKVLNYSILNKARILCQWFEYNLKFRQIIRIAGISIIWCSNLRGLLTCFAGAKLNRTPLIWNLWLTEMSGWFRVLNRIGYFVASRIITEYNGQKEEIFGARLGKNKKIVRIYTGHDLNESIISENKPLPHFNKNRTVIGTIGEIVPRKGFHFFIEMAVKILQERNDVDFFIIGGPPKGMDDSHFKYLKLKIKNSGIQDHFYMPGWRQDIAKILPQFHIYVFTSIKEGLLGAAREAACASLPIVAMDTGGIRDIVLHKKTGYIVPKADINGLIAHVKYLIKHPAERKRMGEAGRNRVKCLFSLEKYIRDTEELFNEVAQGIKNEP